MPVYQSALEPYADSVSAFENEGDHAIWTLQAVLTKSVDQPAMKAALALAAFASGQTEPEIAIEPLPETDWLAAVAASFPPFRVGKVFVHGSHYMPRGGEGPIRLRVDAGSAFGSGEHQTTQGCLLAMQDLAKRTRKARVLDMGCGSGILAMAAAHLWHPAVHAVDIDDEAVRVTNANARLNGLARHLDAEAGNGYRARGVMRAGPFDLIVSNILAGPLRRMAHDLAQNLAPGGHAILSGLLWWQEKAVLASHRAQGLRLVRRIRIGEWTTLVLRKA